MHYDPWDTRLSRFSRCIMLSGYALPSAMDKTRERICGGGLILLLTTQNHLLLTKVVGTAFMVHHAQCLECCNGDKRQPVSALTSFATNSAARGPEIKRLRPASGNRLHADCGLLAGWEAKSSRAFSHKIDGRVARPGAAKPSFLVVKYIAHNPDTRKELLWFLSQA